MIEKTDKTLFQIKNLYVKDIKDFEGKVEALAVSNQIVNINDMILVTGTIFTISKIQDIWFSSLPIIGSICESNRLEYLRDSIINYYSFESKISKDGFQLYAELVKLYQRGYRISFKLDTLIIITYLHKKNKLQVQRDKDGKLWHIIENDKMQPLLASTDQLIKVLNNLTNVIEG